MVFGIAASAVLLPWYILTDFASFDREFFSSFDLDFLREPDAGSAFWVCLAGAGGGIALLLLKQPLAPLVSAAAGLLIVVVTLSEADRFDGTGLAAQLGAGFYVTLIAAVFATLLSLHLAYRLTHPPPDPNVIPRVEEQFPRL
jgi:hypothetical protein